MPDVTVEHKESLSREQAAAWLHVLSQALRKGGEATLPLGSAEGSGTTLSLRLPNELRAEFEVEVDGHEVQIEVELSWSTDPVGAEDASSTKAKSGARKSEKAEAADYTEES